MVFLYINQKNYKKGKENLVEQLDKHMGKKDNKIFLLIFMEGCGPCAATRPEWAKLKNVLSDDFLNRDDIVVASIDHELCEQLKNLKSKPPSFPTMRFITGGGDDVENYEDSSIENKDRTVDSFVEWIKLKSGEDVDKENKHMGVNKQMEGNKQMGGNKQTRGKRRSKTRKLRKNKKGGKKYND